MVQYGGYFEVVSDCFVVFLLLPHLSGNKCSIYLKSNIYLSPRTNLYMDFYAEHCTKPGSRGGIAGDGELYMATPKVPDVGTVADKWATVTAGRAAQYKSGVEGGKDWATAAAAAVNNFVAGITQGNIGAKFAGGVRSAGTEKFKRGVAEKGVNRFSAGVTAGKTDYSTGMAPVLATIGATQLSDRQPRGSQANYQRVQQIGDALHAKRLAAMGASS